MYSACFQDVLPSLAEVYAKQVLQLNSDRTSSQEVVEASKMLMKEMSAITPRRRVDVWTLPSGLVPVQSFLGHTTYFFENV